MLERFLPSPYLALSFPQFDKPKFLGRDNEILVPLFLSITVPEDGTNYALWFETLDLKKRVSFFAYHSRALSFKPFLHTFWEPRQFHMFGQFCLSIGNNLWVYD